MAGILSTPTNVGKYKDPKAQILYGAGNSKITDNEIRNFISQPGRKDDDIFGAALAHGISAAQISRAMKSDPAYSTDNVNKYISGKGVSMDREPGGMLYEPIKMPPPVVAKPITVGTNETVQGQLHSILEKPNSPLMVQAATMGNSYANKRGMLDSSIGASAAQSSMINSATPIAQQDASTYYDAKKTNVSNDLQAGFFNSDQATRVSMFDKGTAKDLAIQGMSNELQRDIARMDSDNKLAIANIQAMANDSGIVGDLGKTLMSLYQQTASNLDLTDELKAETYNNLKSMATDIASLLPSFKKQSSILNFSGVSIPVGANNAGSTTGSTSGVSNVTGSSTSVPAVAKKVNVLGYQPEPTTLSEVAAYERQTGNKVDRSKVVPQQLIEDMRYGNMTMAYGQSYLANDGTTKTRNFTAYDYQKLMKDTGAKNQGELFSKLFVPVYQPRTMRAESVMFYVWNPNVSIS